MPFVPVFFVPTPVVYFAAVPAAPPAEPFLSHRMAELAQAAARLQGQNLALATFAIAASQVVQAPQRARLAGVFKRLCDEVLPEEQGLPGEAESRQSFDDIALTLSQAFRA